MSSATNIQNNIERWLVHEGLKFKYQKHDTSATFKVVISGPPDVQDIDTEVFEPASQQGVIVVGKKCLFSTARNQRFLTLTKSEQQRVQDRISEYCNSIGAVHRFLIDNGRHMVGVYVVIDSQEMQNQSYFSESLKKVATMSDGVKEYMRRTI